jgi:thiol-disulfide isomerase/thioredoxin
MQYMRRLHTLAIPALFLAGLSAYAQTVPRPAGEFAIDMPGGGQTLLSQYAGKVVVLAFISTTCPHCQKTTQLLSTIQKDYGARGVQFLAAAFNPDAATLVPGFISQFRPTFPVGSAPRDRVMEYEQASMAKPNYVPVLMFIDRKRVIRAQYMGGEDFLNENKQDANIRGLLDTLLKDGPSAKSSHPAHKAQATKPS